jgi:acetyl esterase/lipase
MPSQEHARAIELQQGLLQEFVAVQTPEEFRALYSRFMAQFPVAEDVTFEPVDAGGVPAEWMIPPNAADNRTILYVHGGGYAIGSAKDYREMVARIARAAGARALTLDYRLAPEYAHPAAVEDGVAAYRWLLAQGTEPGRIVIAGDSAGGGLTVATLVSARDQGMPLPAGGVCISPWVDMEGIGASMDTNAEADPLVKRDLIKGMADGYLQGQDPRTALAAPLYADLTGLPPLLIQVGSIETLLDDARRLAERAKTAGVEVTLEEYPDMPHVWHMFGSFLPEAQQAIAQIGEFVQQRTSRVTVA